MGWKSKLAGVTLTVAVIVGVLILNSNPKEKIVTKINDENFFDTKDKVQQNAEEKFAINNGINIGFTKTTVLENIIQKMDDMCKTFPGNEDDCFMLKSVINPVPESDKIPALTRKFLSKLLTDDKDLTAVFTGTSNTAGHGNFYANSYPFALGHILTDFFQEQVGINFKSENSAIGSVGAFPRAYHCQPATYGENVDIMGFEFGMFGVRECGKEQFMRTAIATQYNPVFAIPNPGGPAHCANAYTGLYYSLGDQKQEFLNHLAFECQDSFDGDTYHDWEYFMSDQFLEDCGRGQADLDYLSQFTIDESVRLELHHNAEPGTKDSYLARDYGDFGFTNYDFSRGTAEDSLPFWLIRATHCRVAHHPGELGHYLMGHQIGYWMMEHFKEAIELIIGKNAEELEQLRDEAIERDEMPDLSVESCELPGKKQTQCWMTMEPRYNTPLEDMIISPNDIERKNFFGPARNSIQGYADVHECIEVKTDMEDIVISFNVEENMNENHADGRVWVVLCGHEHLKSEVEVDGELIDYSNMDDADTWKIYNYEISDDERPQQHGSDGHANHAMCMALKPVHVGTHTLTIRAKENGFTFKMLFLS